MPTGPHRHTDRDQIHHICLQTQANKAITNLYTSITHLHRRYPGYKDWTPVQHGHNDSLSCFSTVNNSTALKLLIIQNKPFCLSIPSEKVSLYVCGPPGAHWLMNGCTDVQVNRSRADGHFGPFSSEVQQESNHVPSVALHQNGKDCVGLVSRILLLLAAMNTGNISNIHHCVCFLSCSIISWKTVIQLFQSPRCQTVVYSTQGCPRTNNRSAQPCLWK